jgi:hypothetical protein
MRDFCDALVSNDRAALRAAIDPFLATLGADEPIKARMAKVVAWVLEHPCVKAAELSPDLLDREPPVQEIAVTLRAASPPLRTLGIVRDPRGLRFDHR